MGRSATIFDTVNKLFGLKLETAILSIPPLEYNNCSLNSLTYCLKSQTNIHEIDQVILKNQCSTKHLEIHKIIRFLTPIFCNLSSRVISSIEESRRFKHFSVMLSMAISITPSSVLCKRRNH